MDPILTANPLPTVPVPPEISALGDAGLFLWLLFAETTGYLEIRTIPEGPGVPMQHFYNLPRQIAEAARWALARSGHDHVYFGVYPRANPSGRESDVRLVQCAFADLDSKDYAGGESEIEEHIAVLSDKGYPPTISVRSGGGGRHLYWMFDHPVALPLQTRDRRPNPDREALEDVLYGLAAELGLAPQTNVVHDLPRILRVPGTTNIKAKYGSPQLCSIDAIDVTRRYPTKAFAPIREAHPRPTVSQTGRTGRAAVTFSTTRPNPQADPDELLADLAVSQQIRDLIHSPPPRGQRSEADQKVITALLAAGAAPDQIRAIWSAAPIGAKYRERRDGDRYLAYSMGRAKTWLASHPREPLPEADERQAVQVLAALVEDDDPQMILAMSGEASVKQRVGALVQLLDYGASPGTVYGAASIFAQVSQVDTETASEEYRRAAWVFQNKVRAEQADAQEGEMSDDNR